MKISKALDEACGQNGMYLSEVQAACLTFLEHSDGEQTVKELRERLKSFIYHCRTNREAA